MSDTTNKPPTVPEKAMILLDELSTMKGNLEMALRHLRRQEIDSAIVTIKSVAAHITTVEDYLDKVT